MIRTSMEELEGILVDPEVQLPVMKYKLKWFIGRALSRTKRVLEIATGIGLLRGDKELNTRSLGTALNLFNEDVSRLLSQEVNYNFDIEGESSNSE